MWEGDARWGLKFAHLFALMTVSEAAWSSSRSRLLKVRRLVFRSHIALPSFVSLGESAI